MRLNFTKKITKLIISDTVFIILCLVISTFAISKTTFNTVLLPIPIYLFFYFKNTLSRTQNPNWNNYFIIILFSTIVITSYSIHLIYSFDPNYIKFLDGDSYYSTKIADFINTFGVETAATDYFSISTIYPEPYHYFEIWLCTVLSNIFGIRTDFVMTLIVYPLFCILGNIAIYETYHHKFHSINKYLFLFLICSIPFYFGFEFLYPKFILSSDVYSMSLVSTHKLSVIYYFVSISILNISHKNYKNLLLTLMIASLGFGSTIPGFAFMVLLVSIYLIYLKKIKYPSVLFYFTSFIYIIIFYYFNYPSNLAENIPTINFVKYFKTLINIQIGGTFQYAIISVSLLIISYFIYRKKYFQINNMIFSTMLFLVLLPICGLMGWAIMHPINVDSIQFYANILIPVFAIILFISAIILIQLTSNNKIVVIILIFLSIMAYSVNYKNLPQTNFITAKKYITVKEFIGNYNGFFVGQNNNISDFMELFPYGDQDTQYMTTIVHPYIYRNMAVNPFTGEVDYDAAIYIKSLPYYKYAQKNNFAPNLELKFVKEYKIKFFMAGKKSILPQNLKPFVTDSLVLSDNQKIYKLAID